MAGTGEEEPLYGGAGRSPRAVRIGDTVHRPVGRWTGAVHGVLAHLAEVGFDGAPRVLGVDAEGREVLEFIEGRPGIIPQPKEMFTDEGLASVAWLLRRYHDAVASYRPSWLAEWASGPRPVREGEIILHIDNGPWNTIWRAGRAVAFVDWDLAEPGPAALDVAFGCWFNVPLVDDGAAPAWGFDVGLDRLRRLHVFCEAYGIEATPALLDEIESAQLDQARRIEALAAKGWDPWREFALIGLPERARRAAAWLREHRGSFLRE